MFYTFVVRYNRKQAKLASFIEKAVNFLFSLFASVDKSQPQVSFDELPTRQAFRKAVAELIGLGSASIKLNLDSRSLACEVLGPVLYVPNPDPLGKNQAYIAIAPGIVGACYFSGEDFVLAGQNPNALPIDLVTDLLEAIHLYIEMYYEAQD